MIEEKAIKEIENQINCLLKKGFKDNKGKQLKDDPDFLRLCENFKNAKRFQIANFESYSELKEKFMHLATAYCLAIDLKNTHD